MINMDKNSRSDALTFKKLVDQQYIACKTTIKLIQFWYFVAPLSDIPMFYIKYLTMQRVHVHAGAIRQLLHVAVRIREIIYSLKLVDYPPVHTQKPYNNLHLSHRHPAKLQASMRTRGLASAFKVLNNKRKENQISSLTGSLASCLEGTEP